MYVPTIIRPVAVVAPVRTTLQAVIMYQQELDLLQLWQQSRVVLHELINLQKLIDSSYY
jgi:hypothetical protein